MYRFESVSRERKRVDREWMINTNWKRDGEREREEMAYMGHCRRKFIRVNKSYTRCMLKKAVQMQIKNICTNKRMNEKQTYCSSSGGTITTTTRNSNIKREDGRMTEGKKPKRRKLTKHLKCGDMSCSVLIAFAYCAELLSPCCNIGWAVARANAMGCHTTI